MGFLKRPRRPESTPPIQSSTGANPTAPNAPSEFSAEALDAASRCMRTNKDVDSFTRGRGSASLISVAGTSYHKDLIAKIASRYPATRESAGDPGGVAAAIVMRDPHNEHDRNAIRVLVDGLHVGFLPKDEAKQWQPVLIECERRGVTLVGMVRFVGEQRWGLRLQLRDNLPGYSGPITTADREHAEMVIGDGPALRLDREQFNKVAAEISVDENKVPTTKRAAGLLAKHVRDALRDAYAHGAALKATGQEPESERVLALAAEVDDLCDLLIEANGRGRARGRRLADQRRS